MSDDWLKLLISGMQNEIKGLTARVEELEAALYGAEPQDLDEPETYMDGTPVAR